jgi:hypothetical protein
VTDEERSEEPKAEVATAEPEPAAAEKDDKREKKKRKKAKAESAASAVPADPRAVEIATAFDAGNFARVRELGPTLIASGDEALVAVGKDYLARIAVDPVQMVFLLACAVALGTVAWIYIGH